jgi:hypothetical protein
LFDCFPLRSNCDIHFKFLFYGTCSPSYLTNPGPAINQLEMCLQFSFNVNLRVVVVLNMVNYGDKVNTINELDFVDGLNNFQFQTTNFITRFHKSLNLFHNYFFMLCCNLNFAILAQYFSFFLFYIFFFPISSYCIQNNCSMLLRRNCFRIYFFLPETATDQKHCKN